MQRRSRFRATDDDDDDVDDDVMFVSAAVIDKHFWNPSLNSAEVIGENWGAKDEPHDDTGTTKFSNVTVDGKAYGSRGQGSSVGMYSPVSAPGAIHHTRRHGTDLYLNYFPGK